MTGRELEERVFSFIEGHDMIAETDTVYAAVSGGADSVCLLLLLHTYRARKDFTLRVVHVEHGIRGQESLEDERFVRGLCDELALPLLSFSVDAPGCAGENGLSLEEAARKLRYEAFERLDPAGTARGEGGKVRVALAHHREDQAETVLLNLARGTGLRGLGGMQPVRGRYIRPLLDEERSGIEDYLRRNGRTWREDSTNEDVRYARNLIRHRILPVLRGSVNARAVQHICEAADYCSGAASYLETKAQQFAQEHMRTEGGRVILETVPLRQEEGILRTHVLRLAVQTVRQGMGLKDIGAVHISDLDDLVFKPRGKHLDLPGLLKAQRVDKTLVLWVEERKEGRS